VDDRTSAQESDADDDIRGDPAGVKTDRAETVVSLKNDRVERNEGEGRGRKRDQEVRPQSCRLLTELSLVADRPAQDDRSTQAQQNIGNGNRHLCEGWLMTDGRLEMSESAIRHL
jgi:hypothetical protein